jgi:hypothetical protein
MGKYKGEGRMGRGKRPKKSLSYRETPTNKIISFEKSNTEEKKGGEKLEMTTADFIKKHFLGKELCIFLGDDAETINYDQASPVNWAYYRGIIEDVDTDDEIITLRVPDVGVMYIDASYNIKAFWESGFSLYKAMRTSLTKKMVGVSSSK